MGNSQNLKEIPKANIGDIAIKIGSGATPRGGKEAYKTIGISLIRSMNVRDLKFNYNDLAFIDEEQAKLLDNVTVKKDDVLLNITGASVARCCIVPESVLPARVNQHVAIIRLNEKRANPYYVQYCLVSQGYKDHLLSIAQGGATREALTKERIESFRVPLPRLSLQNKIATILSTYDDLIENNLRRIKTLEEMAQNLYREWFVNYRFPGHENTRFVDSPLGQIPEKWELVKLGDLIKIRKGKNITKKIIVEGSIPVIAGGKNPAYYHNKSNTKHPVVTISASGANAGFVWLHFENVWASDCSVIDIDTTRYVYYYYLQLKDRKVEVDRLQRGAAQPHVYPKDLMELETIKVPDLVLDVFILEVTPLFQMIGNLYGKNQNLRQTRDLLLPKLISGEVDVSELDIKVPEEAAS